MHQSKKYLALLTTCAFAALTATSDVSAETYRLIHAIGNSEKELGRDLTKSECERRKSEAKKIGEALGTYNEKRGHGSITCLPESIFR